jgi:hypothetical protein
MSAAHMLSKPARRCLAQRLERLQAALSGLARRLHDSIASVVGEHAGGAIRDAVRTALGQATAELPPPEPQPYRRPSYNDPYRDDDEDERYRPDDPYRESERPSYWGESYRAAEQKPDPETGPARVPPRWLALLPAALQALAAWLSRRPSRPSLMLGAAVVSGLVALAVGPVAGVLTAAAGTALGLAGLTEGARDVAGGMAGATAGSA